MSYDATCHCPKCGQFWYECVHDDETYTCPKCGYEDIDIDEIDIYSMEDDVLEDWPIGLERIATK